MTARTPLRVLHLATVPFRPEEGVSRAVLSLAGHLRGSESHIAADVPAGDEFAGHHVLPHWKPDRVLRSRALRGVMQRVRPDVVHLHGGILVSALALEPAFTGVPVVATVYQLLPVPYRELGLRNLGDARRSSLRPGRIAGSALVGLPLTRHLLRSGRIAGICTPDPRVSRALSPYGPVSMARGGANPSEHRARWSDRPTIAFAGRAEQGRGVEELIAAVELLRRRLPGVRLRLMLLPGPAAQRWTAEYGHIEHIELSVGIRSNLHDELAACQVAALPFRIPATITPPLVASEAMAVGLPVVANALSCITPLVRSGVNGALCRDSSPSGIADTLHQVLADPAVWARMSSAARTTIEDEWSWEGAAAATQEAYGQALARLGRREAQAERFAPGVATS